VEIRLLDGSEEACVIRRECTIGGQVGDTVSLIALSPLVEGVSTNGLEWSLVDGTLAFGSTLGISNVLTEPPASVRVREGVLLLVHSRQDAGGREQEPADRMQVAVGAEAGCDEPFTARDVRKED
jgi:thiamine pyrophosphokinase